MQPAYIQRFVRFAVALLLLLLATLLLQPEPVGLKGVTLTTVATVGRYVLFAAPVALLFGVPAGLRPGSLPDRLLQLPVVLLTGIPAVWVGLVLLQMVGPAGTQPAWLPELGATLVAAPWLARALRMGLASAHGRGVRTAAAACLGRVLQQYGNLAVSVLPLAAVLGAGPAGMAGSSSAGTALLGVALPALVSHLAGDLLVTAAEGAEPLEPAARPVLGWIEVGAILAFGVVALRVGISLVAAAIAVAGGALLGLTGAGMGRWGRLAAPDLEAPSLLAPFLAGWLLTVWLKPAGWVVGAAVGLAMAPWLAPVVRRWAAAPAALRAARGRAVAGGVVMLLARALYLEVLLGWVSLAPVPPLSRIVAGAFGMAGLNLVGAGLSAEEPHA